MLFLLTDITLLDILPSLFKQALIFLHNVRKSYLRCFVRKGVLRNFAKFTGKHLRQSLFLNKVTEHLWTTASIMSCDYRILIHLSFCRIFFEFFSVGLVKVKLQFIFPPVFTGLLAFLSFGWSMIVFLKPLNRSSHRRCSLQNTSGRLLLFRHENVLIVLQPCSLLMYMLFC